MNASIVVKIKYIVSKNTNTPTTTTKDRTPTRQSSRSVRQLSDFGKCEKNKKVH